MTGRLKGRRAVVTGGSRGIGAAIVEAFLREGANVAFCHYGDDEGASSTLKRAKSYGPVPLALECDVSNPADVEKFVGEAEATNGPTDILVNNAGISISHPFEDISIEEFDRILAVHLRGSFIMDFSWGLASGRCLPISRWTVRQALQSTPSISADFRTAGLRGKKLGQPRVQLHVGLCSPASSSLFGPVRHCLCPGRVVSKGSIDFVIRKSAER